MIKNRVKNHWYGMENLEDLILSKKIKSDGYEKNYISLDKINFIQESTFKIKKLFSNYPIEEIENLYFVINELKLMISYINDVCDDFYMHKDDLMQIIKNTQEFSANENQQLFKEINPGLIDNSLISTEMASDDDLEFIKNKNSLIQISSEIIDEIGSDPRNTDDENFDKNKIFQKKSNEKLLSEGFSIKYLNNKNKDHFYKIMNELKKSKNIKIQLKEDANGITYIALCNGELNIVEIGYLIEMRKLGLGVKFL